MTLMMMKVYGVVFLYCGTEGPTVLKVRELFIFYSKINKSETESQKSSTPNYIAKLLKHTRFGVEMKRNKF